SHYLYLLLLQPCSSTLFPYTTLFRSVQVRHRRAVRGRGDVHLPDGLGGPLVDRVQDRTLPPPLGVHEQRPGDERGGVSGGARVRSEEHTSELQSREKLVCRLLLEKKK